MLAEAVETPAAEATACGWRSLTDSPFSSPPQAAHPDEGEVPPMRDSNDRAGLTILVTWRMHDATVTTHGDIDICTTGQLAERLAEVMAISPRQLTIDLTGTRYIDAAGCRALARTALALPPGHTLTLRSPSPIARRILAITGLDQVCRIEPTTAPRTARRASARAQRARPLAGSAGDEQVLGDRAAAGGGMGAEAVGVVDQTDLHVVLDLAEQSLDRAGVRHRVG